MSGSSSRDQVWDVFANAIQTFDKKNDDYGDAWRRNGWRGNLSRVFEKADRVRNLVWRADPRVPAVGDESAVETLQDMLNTIAFAIINLKEEVEWGDETPRSQRLDVLGAGYTPGVAQDFYHRVGSQLPHQSSAPIVDPGRGPLGTHDDPTTTRITVNPEELSLLTDQPALPMGADEVRPTERQESGHVPRKPRQNAAVTDSPQA